ncbi:MAG: hypothetical protein WBA74_18270 [Cyclobacteriaceae bacterium]
MKTINEILELTSEQMNMITGGYDPWLGAIDDTPKPPPDDQDG